MFLNCSRSHIWEGKKSLLVNDIVGFQSDILTPLHSLSQKGYGALDLEWGSVTLINIFALAHAYFWLLSPETIKESTHSTNI